MRVNIFGECKVSKEELRYCTHWYSRKLIPKQKLKDLVVNIQVFKKIPKEDKEVIINEEKSKDVCAYLTEVNDNTFTIHLNKKLKRSDIISTIAHEMVHIKQFYLKEFIMGEGTFIWKKKKFNIKDFHYYDLPFEIEAYGREIGLFERYKYHLTERNKKVKK